MIRRGKVIAAKYKVSKYIFFSLSGYTEWVENLKDEDFLLLTLDSLYEWWISKETFGLPETEAGVATPFYNDQGILIMNVYGFLWNVDTFEL